MAFKQPRVPPVREGNQLAATVRELIFFLRDFCLECWMESRRQSEEIEKIKKQLENLR
ncbi:MAG: hypothetical protein IKU73_02010 [Clostridia bacterium]|nr:hypothetical protein [Clostridia bacterium]